MKTISDSISVKELNEMSKNMFENLVKGVVDIEKEVLVLDAPMHADEEAELIKNGSKQENLWGINLYPDKFGQEDFIEFDSMINIRPSANNRVRGVEDEKIREKITKIVNKTIKE